MSTVSPSATARHRLGWLAAALILSALLAGIGSNAWKARADRYAEAVAMTGGDPTRAPLLFRRYGCAGCHEIPGIAGADGQVGGSLAGIRKRVYIGGVAVNSPDHIVRWIVAPQSFSPETAMPQTGISEDEARDVAAYLYAQ
jgi:cytochrome c2